MIGEKELRTDSSLYNRNTAEKQVIHEEVSAAENHPVIMKAFELGRAYDISDATKVDKQPCIVIGSGPTLDEALPRLKEWKGGIICTTSHALSLMRYGIEPTHIVCLDPFNSWDEIAGVDWSKTRTKLVTAPTVWPDLIKKWPNDMILYRQNNGHNDSFYATTLKRQYSQRRQLEGGQPRRDAEFRHIIRTEITLFACSPPLQMFVAELLGYGTLFLVGCDFAYVGDLERFTDWTVEEPERVVEVGNAPPVIIPQKWKSHVHLASDRIKEIEDGTKGAILIKSDNGLISEQVHLYYKKNLISAIRLSMQKCFVIGQGAITELPQATLDELLESQGVMEYPIGSEEMSDNLEDYLAKVGSFVLRVNGGSLFVESANPIPELTRYMTSMDRKYRCSGCETLMDANDSHNHDGDDCPRCKSAKLKKYFDIDIKDNLERIKRRITASGVAFPAPPARIQPKRKKARRARH